MKKKELTIIGINYYPENTAIGLYTSQLAEFFDANNVNVTVICGFPYYPSWKIDKDYQNKSWFVKEKINNVTVYRYKQYVPKNPTFLKRILHLVDFTIGSLINLFKIKKADLVLCIVPFTSTILLGRILSFFKKSKLWIHVQDFEFDAATETNLVKGNNLIFNFLFGMERRLLKSADVTSTISKSMLKKLTKKTPSIKQKLLLPNWVDISDINPEKSIPHAFMKSKSFKILYSGNIGEKQDWNFFLKFANVIEELNDIEVIIVGDGGKKDWLIEKTKEYSCIKHHYPVPYKQLSNLLCYADLHILFQKEEVENTVMPSKILAMMASSKPLLITGKKNSEVSEIINESLCGKYFEAKEIDKIKNYIESLRLNKDEIRGYGENGRKYVSEKYEKNNVLKEFYNTLLQQTNSKIEN